MSNCDIRVNVTQDNPIGVQMEYTTNYNKLTNKPSINGVELVGNKTTQDLHIETGTENWELIKSTTITNNRGDSISVDTQGNTFSLKKFILYITNVSRSDEGTNTVTLTINVNNTNFALQCVMQPGRDTKYHAEYIGVGAYTWTVINNITLSDANASTQYTQGIRTGAKDLGLCTSFAFAGNTNCTFTYYFMGVRA